MHGCDSEPVHLVRCTAGCIDDNRGNALSKSLGLAFPVFLAAVVTRVFLAVVVTVLICMIIPDAECMLLEP
jgi:hypothetical protein